MSSERPAGGRGSLNRDRIVASAVELARREGLAGVSMRRVLERVEGVHGPRNLQVIMVR